MARELPNDPGRRRAIKCAVGLGLGLTFAGGSTLAEGDPASARPMEGDLLVKANDAAAKPLTVDDIDAHGPTFAWAMSADGTIRRGSRLNGLLLLKLDAGELDAGTKALAADGIVAYTSICTHAGCDVDEWIDDERLLSCACHGSVFDPKRGARVVDGPAPRSLPALPLKVVGGRLVVAGPFTSSVGFESA